MVWTISRYYNTDERMLGLLEKVARVIAERVDPGALLVLRGLRTCGFWKTGS